MIDSARRLIALHALLFAAFGLVVLLETPAQGWGVLGCVVAYNVALALVARSCGRLIA